MSWKKRASRLVRVGAWLVLIGGLCFLGLARPVDTEPLEGSSSYLQSMDVLERAFRDQPGQLAASTPLRAGAAQLEIAPPADWSVPLAGNRRLLFVRAEGRRADSVWARALALRQGQRQFLLLSADIMVVSPALREGVLTRLRQTAGIEAGEVLLVGTHTHTGPGGYWDNVIAEQSVGPFDGRVLDFLIDRLSAVALDALADQRPVTVSYAATEMEKPIRNRAGRLELENATLGLVRFSTLDDSSVVDLVNFSAHPISLLSSSGRLSGDYPGVMAQMVADEGRMMIFTPGSIADMKPVWDGVREPNLKARSIAEHLVEDGLGTLVPEVLEKPVLESFEFEVVMPRLQPRLFRSDLLGSWALRDWVAEPLFGSLLDRALVQVLRIGPVVLLGAPADLASSVALPLIEYGRQQGQEVFFVSMADDWIGYVMEEREYLERDFKVNAQFHGPQSGPLFAAVYTRTIDWLAERPLPAAQVAALAGD